jgi:acyl carrier protein
LGNDDIHLTPDSSARDIDEWDSLSHIQLVIAVEKHFKIKFTSGEHPKWKKVGDMIANIERKLNGV